MDATPTDAQLYRSRSRSSRGTAGPSSAGSFVVVRRNNKRLGVAGALIGPGAGFVRALAGDEGVVRDLYAAIFADAHTDLSILREDGIPERAFGRWATAEVGPHGRADTAWSVTRERRHRGRGHRHGCRRHPRPGAGRVLAVMREAPLSLLEQ